MERSPLIPHLTPKEKNQQEYEKQMAKLKARLANIQERMLTQPTSPLAPAVDEVKVETKEKPKVPPITDVSRATGEYRERRLVMKDGHWVDEEFAGE